MADGARGRRPAEEEAVRDAHTVRKLKNVSAVMLCILAATSFTAGIPGLLEAGEWAKLGGLAFLVPIAVDGGLVFSSVSGMAWRAERGKRSKLSGTMVVALSIVSVAAQVAHVSRGQEMTIEGIVGAAVASMFPILVLSSSYQFESLRFAAVVDREAQRAVDREQVRAAARAQSAPPANSQTSVAAGSAAASGDQADRKTAEAAILSRLAAGEHLSGAQIGALLGVSRKTGDRVRARLQEQLRENSDRSADVVQLHRA